MAKRKRRPRNESTAKTSATAVAAPEDPGNSPASGTGEDAATRFVGQWNRLVSTTNWEKGRIICQWREALMSAGAAVTDYSDEAWAQLVGGVTSQHIGRLRRVFQRFGDVCDQYEGLYWSHFQAALDWDDAEMWLEGGIQNGWSVSQMRGKRWEVHGTPPEEQQAETALDAGDDGEAITPTGAVAIEPATSPAPIAPQVAEVKATSTSEAPAPTKRSSRSPLDAAVASPSRRSRLSVDVAALPDDLAEAFEQFKLAIIAHRREGWRDIAPEAVVECLDALTKLVLAGDE